MKIDIAMGKGNLRGKCSMVKGVMGRGKGKGRLKLRHESEGS